MRKLLVVSRWQKDIDAWAVAFGITRNQYRRVMKPMDAKGWHGSRVAIVYLDGTTPDVDTAIDFKILQMEGAPVFECGKQADAARWVKHDDLMAEAQAKCDAIVAEFRKAGLK